jgi:hypothetical protein
MRNAIHEIMILHLTQKDGRLYPSRQQNLLSMISPVTSVIPKNLDTIDKRKSSLGVSESIFIEMVPGAMPGFCQESLAKNQECENLNYQQALA